MRESSSTEGRHFLVFFLSGLSLVLLWNLSNVMVLIGESVALWDAGGGADANSDAGGGADANSDSRVFNLWRWFCISWSRLSALNEDNFSGAKR